MHRYSPFDRRLLLEHRANDPDLLRKMAASLAFVAGAINAGGFLVVHFYTSHVTGTISRVADGVVLGDREAVKTGAFIVMSFLLGAMCTGSLVAFGRRRRLRGKYAFSLAEESILLLIFGLSSASLGNDPRLILPAALLLSFIMGMHNALFTKISHAVVRTTHMTGVLTDLGIELSRLFYYNRTHSRRTKPVMADRERLKLHALLIGSFFMGGICGAYAFPRFGFVAVLPIAGFLFLLSRRTLVFDLRARLKLLSLKRS